MISFISFIPGETITQFSQAGNDIEEPDITYSIKNEGENNLVMDATGYFSIPSHRGEIKKATAKIKCEAEDDSYLSDPRLDIGLDGDYEWRFNGQGYGNAGQQNEFSTGTNKRLVVTAKRGGLNYDNRSYILLPKTANVLNANMKIRGGPGQYTQDLVVGVYYYGGQLYYTRSNRDGTFSGVTSYVRLYTGTSWAYYYGIGIGDFDGDNDLDIVYGEKIWNVNQANFYIIENINATPHPWGNSPTKAFIGSINTSGWLYVTDFAVEDFDDDGNLDFVASFSTGSLHLFRGRGDLSFKNPKQLTASYSGWSYGKDAGDFNNDGYPDIVIGGSATGNVYYYENNGDGTFQTGKAIPFGSGNYQYATIAADFDDDTNIDILTKGRGSGSSPYYMRFVEGNGDGTFKDGVNSNMGFNSRYEPRSGDGYDFNYDGYQDVMVCDSRSFYYYQGQGNGNFNSGSYVGSASYLYSMAAPPRMPLGGCRNLKLDIGDDGTKEKTFTGIFDEAMTQTINFKNELKSLMTSPSNNLPVIIDEYGNQMYKIPLRFDSDTIGSVQLEELDIQYEYTATVDLLPGERYNLTTDLNDLLPIDNNESRIVKVYFGVFSDTPGRVTLSDLEIVYNAAPSFTSIETLTVYEDLDTKVLNLTKLNTQSKPKYFSDDYDAPDEMTYGIFSNSDPEHLSLSVTDDFWLNVDCTLTENWYGTATARVWCRDTEGIETVSNEFTINVLPVNDKPMANNPIPNIELQENNTVAPIDLDDPEKEYFIDVDSDELYFRAVLMDTDEHGEKLTVSVDTDTNRLRITSLSGYGQGIKVKVYCDDDIGLYSLSPSELELIEAYQVVLVNITSSRATFPPEWLPITITPIPEDEPSEHVLMLTDHVMDPDDAKSNLSFSIYSISQSGYLDVIIDDKNFLNLYPKLDFDGTAKVTLLVVDDEHNQDLTTVDVSIIPTNDLPVVEIVEPRNGSMVNGMVEVIGSAYDAEGALAKVEIRVGEDGDWVPVNGLTYWTYDLEVNEYLGTHKGAQQILLKARAEDETGNRSFLDKTYLYIRRPREDSDGDGVQDHMDRFPNNPH
ncbi:MAG: VCBS repeat-containing protein, partial [Thermoplasmata archaeon]|nr:VCBS repeat-containing protein [Thermoplasmata archaeon]